MTWVDVAWTLMASASLTLGVVHLLAWCKRRQDLASLVFFGLAVSVAIFSAFELAMMSAQTPDEHASAVRWAHVPLAAIVFCMVAFVRLYFGLGNPWLAGGAVGLRMLALAFNFATGANLNYGDVLSLEHVPVLGATIAVPVGTPNPWQAIAHVSNLLVVAFVIDASLRLWRQGAPEARRRAAIVGGAIVTCVAIVVVAAQLTVHGYWHVPTVFTASFLIVVMAMAYELSSQVIAAAHLADRLKAREAELRESEQWFRAVVESAPDAIVVADEQGTILHANAQAHTLLGIGRDGLAGQPLERLLRVQASPGHEGARRGLRAFLEEAKPGEDLAIHARRSDGVDVPVEVVARWLPSRTRRSVLLFLTDVSERRRREQADALQRSEIAHLARVAMLGEIAGSLAHELNQPLAAIQSNAQAAQRLIARDPAQVGMLPEILEDVVRSGRRAGDVIRRLRAMLRKEPGHRGEVDVNEMIAESLRLMRSELLARGVAVETALDPKLPAIRGDAVQLQQVVLNLVINACEAVQEPPTSAKLSIRTRTAAPGMIELAVSDQGRGLPEGGAESIFEPFVTTKARGLGLGLAICRSIVAAHRGRLWAADNDGPGATFFLELPALSE